MNVTTSTKNIVLSLTAIEAKTILTALNHTRSEYLTRTDRQFVAATAYQIDSRLTTVIQVVEKNTFALGPAEHV